MPSGSKPGERRGGRAKGTPNRRTQEREDATRKAILAIEASLPAPFSGDAHALMVTVYKDTQLPIDLRLDAAKAAIRFEKSPQPTATHVSGADGGTILSSLLVSFVEPDAGA
nr:hypothetical protein [uncultured Lichenicoccus sp.]